MATIIIIHYREFQDKFHCTIIIMGTITDEATLGPPRSHFHRGTAEMAPPGNQSCCASSMKATTRWEPGVDESGQGQSEHRL